MVRKQVYIEPEHEALLKRRAEELHVTEAALIRRGIEYLSTEAVPVTRVVVMADRQAWAEAKAFIQQHRKLAVPQTGRTWTRAELYDDRLTRVSG